MKKVVGQVSELEKREIQILFERRNGETSIKFQKWWNQMSEKYQWESIDGGNWEIDFDTCEIYLITE